MHAPHAVGVTNGLDALRLIFRAYIELGRLHRGDEVIVPANTYVASILSVTDNGLVPIFVEPDPITLNLDTQRIEQAITPRTRAILPVHLYGRVCWDNTIADVARAHNLIVVEDNAQAIGAEANCDGLFGSRNTGALGHAGAFSFYPTKNIGALGDGGAVVTNDPALADAVRALRNYGSDRQYHNIYKGLNCRLDPMKAAVLTIKLRHLQEENQLRRDRAAIYNAQINNPAVQKPQFLPDNQHVWHQYIVRVDNRDHFRKYLLDNGVETAVHYATPPHRQPCYAEYSHLSLPITDEIARTVVSLPITRTTSLTDAATIAAIITGYQS
jgi:dTDP-4-amino-4,6-dideoxygalactose transaminase